MAGTKDTLQNILQKLETSSTSEAAIQAIVAIQLLSDLLYKDLHNIRALPDTSQNTIYLMDEFVNEISDSLLKTICVLISVNVLDPLTAARLLMELTPEGENRQLMYEVIADYEYLNYFGIRNLATILEEYKLRDLEYIKDSNAVNQFYPFEEPSTLDDTEEADNLETFEE